ncbi:MULTISPECIES: hypothetical protein [unclassified Chryseobacterium]|uniref:C1q-like domain-containing protein n=1 Tax=unclassified Chryseobacterium TaxID=2593645 RepID=UPI00226AF9D3|nr:MULTISPECIES: hypothetical protein [unclassified Chryseobacterium]
MAAKYNSVTAASYAMTTSDFYVSYNGTANASMTLPAAISGAGNFKGRLYTIKNNTSFMVTVTPSGSERINNQTSISVGGNQTVQVISTGLTGAATTWEVYSKSTQSVDALVRVSNSSSYTIGTGINVVDFNNVVFDVNSNFDLSTDRFTAKTAGYYLFTSSFQSMAGSTTQGRYVYFNKNGAIYELMGTAAVEPPNGYAISGSTIVYLAAGDYMTLTAGTGVGSFTVSNVTLSATKISD